MRPGRRPTSTRWSDLLVELGEPTAELRSNIAAESRAKIVYERLITVTDDAGVKQALGFLMTREVAHQKAFEKALYAIEPNFPPGKLPGMPEYTDKYYNMSQGPGDGRGPWNEGKDWEFVGDPEQQAPVDGGEGDALVTSSSQEADPAKKAASRTESRTDKNPTTGADLGAGPGAGSTKQVKGK